MENVAYCLQMGDAVYVMQQAADQIACWHSYENRQSSAPGTSNASRFRENTCSGCIALDNWSGSVAGFIGFRTRPSLNAIISPRSRAASHMRLSAFYLPWSFTTLERRIRSKCGSPFLGDHDAQNSTRRPYE